MVQRPKDLATTLLHRARRLRREDERRLSRAREAVLTALRAFLKDGAVERAWLIGSAAWGGVHGRSDVDIVVKGARGEETGALWDRLSEACGLDVDLLRYEDLDPRFRARVREEGVEVHAS